MRLILNWSTGEYDDFAEYTIPFEFSSVEDLRLALYEKYEARKDLNDQKEKIREKFYAGKLTRKEWEEAEAPLSEEQQIVFGEYQIDIEQFHEFYSDTLADVGIYTVDEWFERGKYVS